MDLLTVVADTHGETDTRLAGRTLTAVRDADLVVHAGDFTTDAVLVGFEAESVRLAAVRGNNDADDVRERLPARRTIDAGGWRLAVVHGHEHDETALSLLGRQEDADLVVVGHSHRPSFDGDGPVPLLNPGSHADPRRYRPAHAELRPADGGLDGRLCGPDGSTLAAFRIE